MKHVNLDVFTFILTHNLLSTRLKVQNNLQLSILIQAGMVSKFKRCFFHDHYHHNFMVDSKSVFTHLKLSNTFKLEVFSHTSFFHLSFSLFSTPHVLHGTFFHFSLSLFQKLSHQVSFLSFLQKVNHVNLIMTGTKIENDLEASLLTTLNFLKPMFVALRVQPIPSLFVTGCFI